MSEESSGEKKKGKSVVTYLGEWVRDIIRIGILFLLLYLYVFQISTVDGSSMSPSFETGDVVIVDKLSYNLGNIERFDVVVLKYPEDPHKDFIKRVIGLPGEEIKIENGRVYVNDEPIEDDFVKHWKYEDFPPPHYQRWGSARRSWIVPKAHYFVLGDNRASSTDSRIFGNVPQDYIKGKVRLRLWPFDRIKFYFGGEE